MCKIIAVLFNQSFFFLLLLISRDIKTATSKTLFLSILPADKVAGQTAAYKEKCEDVCGVWFDLTLH